MSLFNIGDKLVISDKCSSRVLKDAQKIHPYFIVHSYYGEGATDGRGVNFSADIYMDRILGEIKDGLLGILNYI